MLLWEKTTVLRVYNDDTLFLHNDDAVSAHNDDTPPVDDKNKEAQLKLFIRYYVGCLFVLALNVGLFTLGTGDYSIGCPLAACACCVAILISLDYCCGLGRFYAGSFYVCLLGLCSERKEEEGKSGTKQMDDRGDCYCKAAVVSAA